MKTGLVLEGGAMRGMFTAGVLDVMLEQGVKVDGVIAVSAGALFGVNYLSGQHGRAIRYNKRFAADRRYMGLWSLATSGDIVNRDFAYYTVPQLLDVFDDRAFMASGVPFYAVVTNLETGEAEYPRVRSVFADMEILRASGSMPFVSKPVLLGGGKYLDGGVADSIPYQKCLALGYDRLIVVLTRDLSYVKKPMSKRLISLYYHRYPRFAAQLERRHEVYNRSVAALRSLEAQGTALLIRPSVPLELGRMESDPQVLQRTYDQGRADAAAVFAKH